MSSARVRGFTLVEVLLATALLAAGLALAFGTLRAATATVERGEALAAQNEGMRAALGFLRRRLVSAQPVVFHVDPDSGDQLRFHGDAQRLQFVADLPPYLGRGGPALHDIEVVDDGDGRLRLQVRFATVLAGETVAEDAPVEPEPLARGLSEVRLHYRGIDPDGGLTGWMDSWDAPDRLPLLVRVDISDAHSGPWPPMVVALPQAGGLLDSAEIGR